MDLEPNCVRLAASELRSERYIRPDVQVLIVGAGPGGLALGLTLARADIAVTVIEQAATFAREFRGDAVLAAGVRILAGLGLRDRFAELAATPVDAVRLHIRGSTLEGVLPLQSASGAPAVTTIPQQQLLEMLASQAGQMRNFRLVMGTVVQDLAVDGPRVVGVRTTAGELRAPITIGFDGRFSTVRRCAGIELHSARVDFDIAWCLMPLPDDMSARYEAVVHGSEVCFSYPSGERMRVGLLLRKNEFTAMREMGFEHFKQRWIAAASAEIRAPLAAVLRDWNDITLLPAVSQAARTWRRPGMLLLGDAAHPMSPVLAQGINVALADAAAAARVLIGRINSTAPFDVDGALRAIEMQRRPIVRRVQQRQNLLPRLMRVLGPERAIGWGARLLSPMLRPGPKPKLLHRLFDRLVWGDAPARANGDGDGRQEVVERSHRA